MTIGTIGKSFGHSASGTSTLTVLRSRGAGSSAASTLEPNSIKQNLDAGARLFAASVRPLNDRQQTIDKIKAELTDLRRSLQAARDQKAAALSRATSVASQPTPATNAADVYETRAVHIDRTVYETRNIYESQPVYEQQEIRETSLTGTRVLTGFLTFPSAGIGTGDEFSVQVGNESTARIEFKGAGEITATVDGSTQTFSYAINTGQWRTAVTNALSSVSGLSAQIDANGKLELETDNAQSLTIGNVSGSGNPLPELGLTPGTTQSSLIGYQQVAVGEEQVVVGHEQFAVGKEKVQVGKERVKVDKEHGKAEAARVTSDAAATAAQAKAAQRDAIAVEKIRAGIEKLAASSNALVLASQRATGQQATPDMAGLRAFTDDLSATLKTTNVKQLSDTARLDRAIGRIDGLLARAKRLEKPAASGSAAIIPAHQTRAAANALLIQAGLQQASAAVAKR